MTLFTLSASACFKITPIVCAQVSRTGATTCQNRKKIQSTPGNIMKNELENYKRQALLEVSGYCLKFE